MPLKPKKSSILAIFEHFSRQIKLSLKVAKMIFLKISFCNKSPLYKTAILCKTKVGVTRGRLTPSGIPLPPGGIRVGCDYEKTLPLLEKHILHHKLEKKC